MTPLEISFGIGLLMMFCIALSEFLIIRKIYPDLLRKNAELQELKSKPKSKKSKSDREVKLYNAQES